MSLRRAPALDRRIIERDGPQDRLLLLLHGYGEPVADLVDRLDRIDPDARFLVVAPEGPFERKGRRHWHRPTGPDSEGPEQFRASLAAVDRHLGEVSAHLGLPVDDAVVGGFSQGGGLAIALLLGRDTVHRPAAGFGVCSFPPVLDGFRAEPAAASGRPYLLTGAHQDHFAQIDVARAGGALLRDLGLSLTYAETPGAHEMTDEAADLIGTWLAAVAAGEAPQDTGLLNGIPGLGGYFAGTWDLPEGLGR